MFGVPYRASATRTIAGVRTRPFSPTTTPPPRRAAGYALFWLAVIDLPLIFIVLQVIAGRNLGGQITFITTLTCLFLAGAAVLYAAVLARRASPRLLEGRPAAASRHNGYQGCGWVCGSAAYHPVCPTRRPQSQSISSNPTGTVWMNSAVTRMSPTGYRSPTAGPERRPRTPESGGTHQHPGIARRYPAGL
ncbi:MAG: hypothetical protein WCS24_05820 [Methanoculleus sp.]